MLTPMKILCLLEYFLDIGFSFIYSYLKRILFWFTLFESENDATIHRNDDADC